MMFCCCEQSQQFESRSYPTLTSYQPINSFGLTPVWRYSHCYPNKRGGRENHSLGEVYSFILLPSVISQRWKVIINRLWQQQPLSAASFCSQLTAAEVMKPCKQTVHTALREGRRAPAQTGPADREEERSVYGDRGAAALSAFPGTPCLHGFNEGTCPPLPPIHLAGECSYLLVVEDIKNSHHFPGSLTTSALISI